MGMTTKSEGGNTLYLSVIGGNMLQASTEDNPEAKKRDYETSDGKKGTKYEIEHRNLTGNVVGMNFNDGKFGEEFSIVLQSGDEKAQLTVPTSGEYFADFAKKLPNIDLTKPITINPYEMDKDNGKKNRGMSIKQGGEKIANAYWDGKKSLKGMPEVSKEDRKDYDSDDWKMHFIKIKKFLKKKVEAVDIPAYQVVDTAKAETTQNAPKADSPDVDDLPF